MTSVIIVAAGQGVRMGADVPKQFLELGGKPVLAHTLMVFDHSSEVEHIVLCLPDSEIDFCRSDILTSLGLKTPISLVAGGQRRQDSVYNALKTLEGDHIVLIHDGVRPFVTQDIIKACIEGAVQWGACIPTIAVTDTLKRVDADGCIQQTVSRKGLHMAQTPQAFRLSVIKPAHQTARENGWLVTDDASLVERMGLTVRVIPGSPHNIKITTPEDLRRAEAILRKR